MNSTSFMRLIYPMQRKNYSVTCWDLLFARMTGNLAVLKSSRVLRRHPANGEGRVLGATDLALPGQCRSYLTLSTLT